MLSFWNNDNDVAKKRVRIKRTSGTDMEFICLWNVVMLKWWFRVA